MNRHVVTISRDQTIRQAIEKMIGERVSAIPVVSDDGKCAGILSLSDLIEMVFELDHRLSSGSPSDSLLTRVLSWDEITTVLGRQKVEDIMTHQVFSLAPEDACSKAAALMAKTKVHRLPVLDSTGQLVGIVSTMDIARCVAGE